MLSHQYVRVLIVLGFIFSNCEALGQRKVSCVKVIAEGETCESLVVKFDLSRCQSDNSEVRPATVNCVGDGAKVAAKSLKYSYSVQLKLEIGNWGRTSWVQASPVMQSAMEILSPAAVEENEKPKELRKTAVMPAVIAPIAVESKPKGETSIAQQDSGVKAMVDFYYSYNSNKPVIPSSIASDSVSKASIPNGGNLLRYYDINHNQMTLNLVEIGIRKSKGDLSFLLDLDFGSFADQNAAAASPSLSPTSQVIDEVSKHVGQVIVSYRPASAKWFEIDFGKMPTHLGYEVMKAAENWQYSRSTAFGFGGPFWHTGVRLGFTVVPDRIMPSFYFYNGWNSLYDNNSAKTFGAQLKIVASEKLTLIYNLISGAEQTGVNSSIRTVHELNLSAALTPAVSLAVDLLTGSDENVAVGGATVDPSWRSATVYAKIQPHTNYYLSPRFEIYRDSHGFTVGGPEQTVTSATLTNGFLISEGFETRLEFRYDVSTWEARFLKRMDPSKSQFTSTLGVMYWYE